MRFPLHKRLSLPCFFERVMPGKQHRDGKRYLPLLALRLLPPVLPDGPLTTLVSSPDLLLGVVDRHHLIDQELVGQHGTAQLLCLLSTLQMQQPPYQQGIQPESPSVAGQVSMSPRMLGQVLVISSWEIERGHLPYEQLYVELILDIGLGEVGVRTHATAPSIEAALGTPRLQVGDWIEVDRSRIDILGFEVTAQPEL